MPKPGSRFPESRVVGDFHIRASDVLWGARVGCGRWTREGLPPRWWSSSPATGCLCAPENDNERHPASRAVHPRLLVGDPWPCINRVVRVAQFAPRQSTVMCRPRPPRYPAGGSPRTGPVPFHLRARGCPRANALGWARPQGPRTRSASSGSRTSAPSGSICVRCASDGRAAGGQKVAHVDSRGHRDHKDLGQAALPTACLPACKRVLLAQRLVQRRERLHPFDRHTAADVVQLQRPPRLPAFGVLVQVTRPLRRLARRSRGRADDRGRRDPHRRRRTSR